MQRAKKELKKNENNTYLITTSRLVYKNGIDDVIRALASLPQHIQFVIFGTGPDENTLRSLANELDIQNRIHFKGHIDHDVMPLYLKACDIFIRSSRSEGMGNSFVEAMAAELPVIATQEGGIVDFLFDVIGNLLLGTGADALGGALFMVGVLQPAVSLNIDDGIGEVGVRLLGRTLGLRYIFEVTGLLCVPAGFDSPHEAAPR